METDNLIHGGVLLLPILFPVWMQVNRNRTFKRFFAASAITAGTMFGTKVLFDLSWLTPDQIGYVGAFAAIFGFLGFFFDREVIDDGGDDDYVSTDDSEGDDEYEDEDEVPPKSIGRLRAFGFGLPLGLALVTIKGSGLYTAILEACTNAVAHTNPTEALGNSLLVLLALAMSAFSTLWVDKTKVIRRIPFEIFGLLVTMILMALALYFENDVYRMALEMPPEEFTWETWKLWFACIPVGFGIIALTSRYLYEDRWYSQALVGTGCLTMIAGVLATFLAVLNGHWGWGWTTGDTWESYPFALHAALWLPWILKGIAAYMFAWLTETVWTINLSWGRYRRSSRVDVHRLMTFLRTDFAHVGTVVVALLTLCSLAATRPGVSLRGRTHATWDLGSVDGTLYVIALVLLVIAAFRWMIDDEVHQPWINKTLVAALMLAVLGGSGFVDKLIVTDGSLAIAFIGDTVGSFGKSEEEVLDDLDASVLRTDHTDAYIRVLATAEAEGDVKGSIKDLTAEDVVQDLDLYGAVLDIGVENSAVVSNTAHQEIITALAEVNSGLELQLEGYDSAVFTKRTSDTPVPTDMVVGEHTCYVFTGTYGNGKQVVGLRRYTGEKNEAGTHIVVPCEFKME